MPLTVDLLQLANLQLPIFQGSLVDELSNLASSEIKHNIRLEGILFLLYSLYTYESKGFLMVDKTLVAT